MKLLRFYYFTFLYHYRNKPERRAGDFRSLLLVEISICWLILGLWLLGDPEFTTMGSWTKLFIIACNVIILVVLQRYLIKKGNSELIFQEFKNHRLNNQINRTICWAVWAVSFIFFIFSSTLQ